MIYLQYITQRDNRGVDFRSTFDYRKSLEKECVRAHLLRHETLNCTLGQIDIQHITRIETVNNRFTIRIWQSQGLFSPWTCLVCLSMLLTLVTVN